MAPIGWFQKVERRRLGGALIGLLSSLYLLTGCAGSQRFPLREPMLRDPDEQPFFPPPQPYVSPFAWDGANQMVFRPISLFFAVDPAGLPSRDASPRCRIRVVRHGSARRHCWQDVIRGSCSERVLPPTSGWL